MPDWTQDRLLLFLLFFVPGFISIKIYDLLVPSERRDFQSTLAEAIGYSAVNFAVLLPIVATIYGYGMLERMWARCGLSHSAGCPTRLALALHACHPTSVCERFRQPGSQAVGCRLPRSW
jgi:Family of unknown function (DUF6338)